jgi:hypothetical protein
MDFFYKNHILITDQDRYIVNFKITCVVKKATGLGVKNSLLDQCPEFVNIVIIVLTAKSVYNYSSSIRTINKSYKANETLI